MDALQIAQILQAQVLQPLKRQFVGKEEVIDLLAVALVGGENIFLHGPPGTAKSALVNALAKRLQTRSFDYLLTKFTEPSELFGPFDIRKLREGDLVTNTEGMLPEADFIFLDELLNANSAILNSLLLVLNERLFRRGRETRALPVLMVVGASNHLPQDETLKALFDRFLLRVHCDYLPDTALESLLQAGWAMEQASGTVSVASAINADQIRVLQAALAKVDLAPVVGGYVTLIRKLRSAGFEISDRRAVKLQRVVAASALLSGRQEARLSDLWVLRYVWDREEQRELLAGFVNDALQEAAVDAADHPQARPQTAPNPEALLEEIEALTADWAGLNSVVARDRLAALAARVPWVQSLEAREALQEKIDAVWRNNAS
jgi:MoxR-like ATPase